MKIVYSQNCTLFRKYFIIVKSRQLSQRKAVCFLFASAIVGEERSTSPQKRKSLDTLIHLLVTCRKQALRNGKHVII